MGRTPTAVAGTQAISFEAKWEEPVDHEGPWSLIKCKGTRKLVSPIEWSGVTRVEVIVDINNRTVTGLAVTAEPDEDAPVMGSGHLGSVARLYDVESGDIVFEGRGSDLPLPEDFCPVGTHYQG